MTYPLVKVYLVPTETKHKNHHAWDVIAVDDEIWGERVGHVLIRDLIYDRETVSLGINVCGRVISKFPLYPGKTEYALKVFLENILNLINVELVGDVRLLEPIP